MVTDHYIAGSDILSKVTAPLESKKIDDVIYSELAPNLAMKNIEEGLAKWL